MMNKDDFYETYQRLWKVLEKDKVHNREAARVIWTLLLNLFVLYDGREEQVLEMFDAQSSLIRRHLKTRLSNR